MHYIARFLNLSKTLCEEQTKIELKSYSIKIAVQLWPSFLLYGKEQL